MRIPKDSPRRPLCADALSSIDVCAQYAIRGVLVRVVAWSSGKVRERFDAAGLPDSVSLAVRLVLLGAVAMTAAGFA